MVTAVGLIDVALLLFVAVVALLVTVVHALSRVLVAAVAALAVLSTDVGDTPEGPPMR